MTDEIADEMMTRSHRRGIGHTTRVLTAAALLIAASACGSDDTSTDDGNPASASASASASDSGSGSATDSASGSASEPADAETEQADSTDQQDTDDAATDTDTDAESATSADDTGDAESGDGADDGEVATRVVETSFGPIELPVDPRRVIALDEYAAMNLLAVGIEPIQTIGSYSSIVSQRLLADRGVEVIEQTDSFTINFEAVAAAQPDTIVATVESAFATQADGLQEIAPTVVVPYTAPWREVIGDTGELFDRTDESDRIIAGLEQRFAEVSEIVAENPFSLSVLGETFNILFAVSPEAVLSAVIDEVGISRPVAQTEGEPLTGVESVISISTELIGDHDADVVAVMSGVFYDDTVVTG
ncbi:MAG: ABC transporter substrate-binding protein, partial [Actinomycetota bacterium]